MKFRHAPKNTVINTVGESFKLIKLSCGVDFYRGQGISLHGTMV